MRATQIGGQRQGQADLGRLWGPHIRLIAPAYAGVTGLLWVVLSVQGMPPLVALVYAMSTLSTSGIVPHWGAADGIVQEGGDRAVPWAGADPARLARCGGAARLWPALAR